MIEERAIVIGIEDGRLMLEAQTKSSCGSCEARSGCGTSLLGNVLGRRFTHFSADNAVNARVGDEVVVGIPENSLLSGSMMVYLVPIISMLAIALAADGMLLASAPMRDLLVALAAGAGFLLGFLGARYWLQRAVIRHLMNPVVLRKIISHGRI